MRLALIGYGKMGQALEAQAEIAARFDSPAWGSVDLEGVDVCIDFSRGDSVLENCSKVCDAGKDLVIGTTDWELEPVRRLVEQSGIGTIYAPTFSISVYRFIQLVERARELFATCGASGEEIHHTSKRDSPSGTAKLIQERTGIEFESIRRDAEVGTHRVLFEWNGDTIELCHRSASRAGFARGALQAACWVQGRRGFFTLDDMLCSQASTQR